VDRAQTQRLRGRRRSGRILGPSQPDALKGKLASRTVRKRMQGLARRYLEAGIMADETCCI